MYNKLLKRASVYHVFAAIRYLDGPVYPPMHMMFDKEEVYGKVDEFADQMRDVIKMLKDNKKPQEIVEILINNGAGEEEAVLLVQAAMISIGEIRTKEEMKTATAKMKDKERVDKDVRPELFMRNYDYGEGLYHGKMDRFNSVKDFLDKRRKSRKKKKKDLDIYAAIKLANDFEDAVEHAHAIAVEDTTYTGKACYAQTYEGMKSLNDIVNNYDDVGSWSEWQPGELSALDENELISTISSFRGAGWARRAVDWVHGNMPPIVLVETKDAGNIIGDGRGRVSLAIGLNLDSLPAIVLKEDDNGDKCFNFKNGMIVASKGPSHQQIKRMAGDVVDLFTKRRIPSEPEHIDPYCEFCPEENVKLIYKPEEDMWTCPQCSEEFQDEPHEEGAGVFKTEELDPFTRKRMESDE